MKKTLLLIFVIFLISCGNEEDPIYIPETVKIIETVTVEVTKVVEKEKIVYLEPTYNPEPTWTPTPTPKPAATWTPTPTPLPPDDLGYELTRFNFSTNIIEIGQVIIVGVPSPHSPVVDSNRNNDLIDEIKVVNDPQNYKVIGVTQKPNLVSEITLVAVTPTGITNIALDFYTTKK